MIDMRLFIRDGNSVVRADARTHAAAHAGGRIDLRLARVVLLHFARA